MSLSPEQHAENMVEGRESLPRKQSESFRDATPTSLGWGVHGSGPVNETERANTARVALGAEQQGPENINVDADEQMAPFAEGKVADAVEHKAGMQKIPGETVFEEDYGEGIERKKREQAEAREMIKNQRKHGIDVDGSLGQGRIGTEDNSAV